MNKEAAFEKLFERGNIGNLELKNRIIMPPMGTRLCGQWGEVNDDLIEWYVRRARGGVGLIVVEVTHAATAFDPVRYSSRVIRADDESYFPGLFRLAEAIHDNGAKAGINLTVGFGFTSSSGPWEPLGREYLEEPVLTSPSAIPSHVGERRVRALGIAEIEKMIELIGHAAKRVKQAGFDTIEINAHAGYIISEFLSPYFNRRTDKYGGNLDGRLRMLLEIIDSVRANVGPDFSLIVKYAVEERIEGGRDIREGLVIAQRLQEQGINAISVSMGTYGSKLDVIAPYYASEGYMLHLAEALKKAVQIPIYLSGRLGNPMLAERVLKEGKADFIALGRPLIADPDWARKVAQGRLKEIRMCLSCNDCSKVHYLHKGPIRCTVNAAAGREREYEAILRARRPRRIMIVGAGPAGMEAARVAALRGHNVTLYEKTEELGGGQLKFAAMPPHKEILRSYIVDYHREIFGQLKNLKVELGKEVTAQDVLNDSPDVVIVATGAEPVLPDIPGTDRADVTTVFDLLSGKVKAGNTVIVVGGGSVGCETANFLAQQGKKVTIVEMLDIVATDIEARVWIALKDELSKFEVRIMTGLKLDAVTDQGAMFSDKKGQRLSLKADTIVLAVGVKPVNRLARELENKVKEVYAIGDADQPRTIRNAVSDGYAIAYRI